MRLFQISRISLFTLRRFSTSKNNGLKSQPMQSSLTSQRKRNVKKNLFLQVVELQPKQVWTNEMISNSRRVGVSLASNKNLYDLCAHYQTDVDPGVKTVSFYDFKLYDSQTLTAFDNPFMKLSDLSEDVGSISHPLLLTYVDRTIKEISVFVKIIKLLPNQEMSEHMITEAQSIRRVRRVSLPSTRTLFDLIDTIKFPADVDTERIDLWNSKHLLLQFNNLNDELSSLPCGVGNIDNPLILSCYLKRNYTGVEADIASYWNWLYDTPLPGSEEIAKQNRRYDIGGIMYRENKLVPWNLYWRDCYWYHCERYWNTKLDYVVFTGTPGIGKSVFRSFMVWWQIQKAKESKSTEVILLMKSPSEGTSVYAAFIDKGNLTSLFSCDDTHFDELKNDINSQHLRTLIHVDVSGGNSEFSGKSINNRVVYMYPSPNENAWNEPVKYKGYVDFVPSWTNDELHDFYLKMGANYVLVNKLSLVRLIGLDDSFPQMPFDSNQKLELESSDKLYPLEIRTIEGEEFVMLTCDNGQNYCTTYNHFKQAIDDEVVQFGPIPRYLFMDPEALGYRMTSIGNAVDDKDVDRLLTKELNDSSFHRLVDMPLIEKEDHLYMKDSCPSRLRYLGSIVEDQVLTRMANKLTDRFLNTLWKKTWEVSDIDHKWTELVYLSLLSFKMNCFNFIPVDNSLSTRICRSFDSARVVRETSKGIQLSRLRNDAFNLFLRDANRCNLVACPILDNRYPVIDGVLHLKYRDEDNVEICITALLQVTLPKKDHPTDKGLMNELLELIKEGARQHSIQNHRIEYWWLIPKRDGKPTKSLWPYLEEVEICERILHLK